MRDAAGSALSPRAGGETNSASPTAAMRHLVIDVCDIIVPYPGGTQRSNRCRRWKTEQRQAATACCRLHCTELSGVGRDFMPPTGIGFGNGLGDADSVVWTLLSAVQPLVASASFSSASRF